MLYALKLLALLGKFLFADKIFLDAAMV